MPFSARRNGLVLLALGAVAILAPLLSPVWGLAAVGIAIFLAGIAELADAWYSDGTRTHYSSAVYSVMVRCALARSAGRKSGR